jgi:hypothetical protein
MTNNIKELWLIAVPLVKKIKVSTFNFETTKLIQAENLVSFKENGSFKSHYFYDRIHLNIFL